MFKGCHFPSEVILETVRYYLAYKLSYREIEEIQLERGVVVDHATINRWVIKFTPVLEHRGRRRKKPVSDSWRMGEAENTSSTRLEVNGRSLGKFAWTRSVDDV